MAEKRYYWLKLFDDFFDDKRIKKLRSIAGGDTYTIIYLKMKLKALNTNGFLYYDGVMDTFAEELALDINEDPENVKLTIQYLISKDLLAEVDEETFQLTCMDNEIGSETAHTQRQRDYIKRKKEREASFCDVNVTRKLQVSDVDIDIEKEKEIDKENNKKKFVPPTLEEIRAYCLERHNNVNPQQFFDYYNAGHWKDQSGKSVRNWKQKMIAVWEKKDNGRNSTTSQTSNLIDYRLSDV